MTRRREFLRRALLLAGGAWPLAGHADEISYAPVTAGVALRFPRDYGAHPAHRVEWWYVTGWLERAPVGHTPPCGFQVTFFRVRTPLTPDASRFTATQLLFAHAAVSDPRVGHILHEERAARAGFGLAEAATGDTDVGIRHWRLRREPAGVYRTSIQGREFSLQLACQPTQALLLQGSDGFSQKGPAAGNASNYYSEPQLQVSGDITVRGRREAVRGVAWLDHEWSSALMPPAAAGWDWLGLNLDGGGAVMAFQMRSSAAGTTALWSDAKLRLADGRVFQPQRNEIEFVPERHWVSPRGGRYPVQARITLGERILFLRPLFDAQEVYAPSMGNVYWEGAVTAYDSEHAGAKSIGRGYWELTGYGKPQRV